MRKIYFYYNALTHFNFRFLWSPLYTKNLPDEHLATTYTTL